jgi:hypothetical protein
MAATVTLPAAQPATTTLTLRFPRVSRAKAQLAARILADAIDALVAEDGLERIADAVTDLKIALGGNAQ